MHLVEEFSAFARVLFIFATFDSILCTSLDTLFDAALLSFPHCSFPLWPSFHTFQASSYQERNYIRKAVPDKNDKGGDDEDDDDKGDDEDDDDDNGGDDGEDDDEDDEVHESSPG